MSNTTFNRVTTDSTRAVVFEHKRPHNVTTCWSSTNQHGAGCVDFRYGDQALPAGALPLGVVDADGTFTSMFAAADGRVSDNLIELLVENLLDMQSEASLMGNPEADLFRMPCTTRAEWFAKYLTGDVNYAAVENMTRYLMVCPPGRKGEILPRIERAGKEATSRFLTLSQSARARANSHAPTADSWAQAFSVR